MADSNHALPEVVRVDHGGWISGPMLGTEPVEAARIRRGDVIVHDGRHLVVTETTRCWYYESGERVKGVEIATRAEGSRWCLYRSHGEIVHRLSAGGAL